MRVLLILAVAVAQILGPWLCCCGILRLNTATHHQAAATPANECGTACSCCCKSNPPSHDEPAPAREPERCPCCTTLAVMVPADKPDVPTADTLLVVVAVEPSQAVAVESVSPRTLAGLREVPHLTMAERLYAHHVLRC